MGNLATPIDKTKTCVGPCRYVKGYEGPVCDIESNGTDSTPNEYCDIPFCREFLNFLYFNTRYLSQSCAGIVPAKFSGIKGL